MPSLLCMHLSTVRVCAVQSMVQDIMRGEWGWREVQEALNDCLLDQAVVHLLRAVTSIQMLACSAEYEVLFTALNDEYR